MGDETIFFQSGNIAVTNTRFIAGSQTFAMGGITSVEGIEIPASPIAPVLLIIIGLILAVSGFGGAWPFIIVGLLIIAGGVLLAVCRKSKFSVVLRTAGGEVTAYSSNDKSLIAEIIRAINASIVSRG
jgi:hypothetical protein